MVGYASERINARGIRGFDPATGNIVVVQPDYLQEPGTMVDLVLKKGFRMWDTDLTLSFEARNILGEEYREYQAFGGGRADVMRYDLGTTYSFEIRSEEHTSELQSLMRISYAVFCLKKQTTPIDTLPKYSTRDSAEDKKE